MKTKLSVILFSLVMMGTITAQDQSAWMTEAYELIKNKPFNELQMLGSHNSLHSSDGGNNSVDQQGTAILSHYKAGARFFEISMQGHGGTPLYPAVWRSFHGVSTGNDQIISQMEALRDEVAKHPNEIIILDLNHISNYTTQGQGSEWGDIDLRRAASRTLWNIFKSLDIIEPSVVPNGLKSTFEQMRSNGQVVLFGLSDFEVPDTGYDRTVFFGRAESNGKSHDSSYQLDEAKYDGQDASNPALRPYVKQWLVHNCTTFPEGTDNLWVRQFADNRSGFLKNGADYWNASFTKMLRPDDRDLVGRTWNIIKLEWFGYWGELNQASQEIKNRHLKHGRLR